MSDGTDPEEKSEREPGDFRTICQIDDETQKTLLTLLDRLTFPNRAKHATRVNQTAMAVGLTRSFGRPQAVVGVNTKRALSLIKTLKSLVGTIYPEFAYTTIQINKNYPGSLHVDRNNKGPSVMFTVGHDLNGGALWLDGTPRITQNRVIEFNGNLPHMTLPYTGTRYSLVLFTSGDALFAPGKVFAKLRALGFSAHETSVYTSKPVGQPGEILKRAAGIIRYQIRKKQLPEAVRSRLGKFTA